MNEDLKTFAPLDRVRERVSQEKADSDVGVLLLVVVLRRVYDKAVGRCTCSYYSG